MDKEASDCEGHMPFIHKRWRRLDLVYSFIHWQEDSSNFSCSFKSLETQRMLELRCIVMVARILETNTCVFVHNTLTEQGSSVGANIIVARSHSHGQGGFRLWGAFAFHFIHKWWRRLDLVYSFIHWQKDHPISHVVSKSLETQRMLELLCNTVGY